MDNPIRHTALSQYGWRAQLAARQWLRTLRSSGEAVFAIQYWRYLTGRKRSSPVKPVGMTRHRADHLRTAVVLSIGRTLTSKLAPAVFIGLQETGRGRQPIPIYNLTRGIPGHPKGSTVSAATLRAAGFTPPPPPKKNPRRNARGVPEDDERWAQAARYLTEIAEEGAGFPEGWRIPFEGPPKKKNPPRARRRRKPRSARKNWPCPSESNPPRARAAGGPKRTLIYPSYTVTHGTTGRGLHVTGGRYYHKSGRRKVAIYGLPDGSVTFKPHEGRLWGY